LNHIAGALAEETAGLSLMGKNPAAVALGQRGGRIGGKARAHDLSPRERGNIARLVALRRWRPDDDF
jgi:hypothetical protein